MKTWPTMPMAHVTRLVTDGKHGDCEDEKESGYFFLSSKDLRDGRLQYDKPRQITKSGFLETHRRTNLEPGDILLANCGASIGRVGLAQNDPRIYKTTFQKSVSVIKANTNIVDNIFLYYFLCYKSALLIRLGNGAAQPNLLIGDLKRIEVPVPPLPIQQCIAGILSAYDELIENNQRRIKILETMARNLYREWFVHFRFPGHENHPRVDSALGEIPQGWEVMFVKDVATVTYGFPFKSNKFTTEGIGTPVIRIRDILAGVSATFTEEQAEPKYHIRNGHILVGMDGDFHMNIWSSGHAYQNQRVARFESKGDISNFHLFLALEKPIQELNKAIVGTTVAHLGDMHIKMIQIVWTSEIIRSKVGEFLEPLSEQIITLKQQTSNLCRTRDLLLPRLLSGQINVENLE
ncbi:restriction endonuclease subunit S [Methylomonas sp. MO1]|uniref:restriction endonuclease subunit S n=1 Tax=Methylomonas sp. MO1 TaxID=3073619 RepID=UPI0028A45079|nr:restriction endonuclease subunit S [Methylomonas sp. MO1]MDT4289545.1 restriction endonuclease subunit S [Methylomonas sp. MO1]